MTLRAPHYGYAYQDLVTGMALVDLLLGTAQAISVDTKAFTSDRFDDVTVEYRDGRRVRVQIKHTSVERQLAKSTFSADGRSLKLNEVFDSLIKDLDKNPQTSYRVIVCDGEPDTDLAKVLKPLDASDDPGDAFQGFNTRRYRFDPDALRNDNPWKKLVSHLADQRLQDACRALVVDTTAPASALSFADPGPIERALLRRCREELGAGRAPNSQIPPKYVARALADCATSARATDGTILREALERECGLITDFGAVAEGHPIEPAVVVDRAGASSGVSQYIDVVVPDGGRVVVTGEPGVGKSWLCEQIADDYSARGWTVARHHCWLGSGDAYRRERVLTEVVIGSLLRQLEAHVPASTTGLIPRFAASSEALTLALRKCRDIDTSKNVLLIVDGLDHVDRVLGRNTIEPMDPSRMLVDALARIDLPPGVCLLMASQPGPHLADAQPSQLTGGPIQMPRMSWEEVRTLSTKHGLLDLSGKDQKLDESQVKAVIDLVYGRSGGNPLYATYLCRHAGHASPLELEASTTVPFADIVRRLEQVPITAKDVDEYYTHLLSGMTEGQFFAIGALALCDFALTVDELGAVLPAVEQLLKTALAGVAPVLNSQPGLGGLRIHHESFSRHIRQRLDDEQVRSIREALAAWLSVRGFYTDARSFRHLPRLLANLDRYDDLKALVQPGFVADAIHSLQPPEAVIGVLSVVARESQVRLDWPTLITCVETRKSVDTYESEALTDSIVEYADVVVATVGPEVVAERLIYDGRTTFPARWGLRICDAVDRAGAAAPWQAYMDAWQRESERERTHYTSNEDSTLQLALQRGALRLRAHRMDYPAGFITDVAKHLQREFDAPLIDMVEVFVDGLPAETMAEVAAAMKKSTDAARVFLALADLAATGKPGLPPAAALAREAWTRDPALDIARYLGHGIAPSDVLGVQSIEDLKNEFAKLTEAVLKPGHPKEQVVQRWLTLLTIIRTIDKTIPLKHPAQLAGPGFYRAWLRYAVATAGINDDVASGILRPEDASAAVRIAVGDLAAESHKPFVGSPNATDLYFIHALVHQVIEKSLLKVEQDDLDPILNDLIAIGQGTTTVTNLGTPPSGPLIVNDLLSILARISDHVGIAAVHSLMAKVREQRDDTNAGYSESADFELATARICHAAGDIDEADQCWQRACLFLSSYGGHKDPTLSELTDSIDDVAAIDLDTARRFLGKLVDPVYLVVQHTDGRDTSHYTNRWWECAADVDPTAAAIGGADALLNAVGFEDGRAYAAHQHLLTHRTAIADPVVLAALRLTVGSNWRQPTTDVELVGRLVTERGTSPQGDAMLATFANLVASSYDDQAMLHSGDVPSTIATPELVNAVVALGGPSFPVREPRREQERKSRWDRGDGADAHHLQKSLIDDQRPNLPAGRAGLVVAARDYEHKQYRDDTTAPRWNVDALANAIGWRIIEAVASEGTDAGISLIDDLAREVSASSTNEVFAVVGEGLALRCDETLPDGLKTVAAFCLTLAYIRIRGGGGWRRFAGRERSDLWAKACTLDAATAERTLAGAVAQAVNTSAASTYGITQAIVAAFAAQPASTETGTASHCWDAAYRVIAPRLPGEAHRFGHSYRPTPTPDSPEATDTALATLAIATIGQPARPDLRQALLAAALLLTCRPPIAQKALAHVLASDLDAGRVTWLLDVLRQFPPTGGLTDELSEVLAGLVSTDWLSVRGLASMILHSHGCAVPGLPATQPAVAIRSAFRDAVKEHE